MESSLSIVLVVTLMTSLVLSHPLNDKKTCDSDNCKLPHCRCWNDQYRPGNFSETETPQIIVLSFDFAFNRHTVKGYEQIFTSLRNPNGCPAKGTFFVQALGSDAGTVSKLHHDKHEIAINSANGIIPTSVEEWKNSFGEVMKLIKAAGVPENEIKGVRAPNLFSGGNQELETLKEMKFAYDASCVNTDYSDPKKLLWPYTMDFVDGIPKCDIGHTANKSFAGVWTMPMPVLKFRGVECPTPSGCLPMVNDTDLIFDLFFDAFDAHYYNNRAPFILDIDAQWVSDATRILGTKEFLEIIAAYPDTWIITMSQALEWVQNPTRMPFGATFNPWSC